MLTFPTLPSWWVVGYDHDVTVVCEPFEDVNQELCEPRRGFWCFGRGGSFLKGSGSVRPGVAGP